MLVCDGTDRGWIVESVRAAVKLVYEYGKAMIRCTVFGAKRRVASRADFAQRTFVPCLVFFAMLLVYGGNRTMRY